MGIIVRMQNASALHTADWFSLLAWNAFACDYNASLLLEQAELMVKYGLVDIGYTGFHIDDCYAEKNRSSKGEIVADPVKFPAGMSNFTRSVKGLGL